jgi:predicted metal-dependent phosphoesterase TrpH
MCTFPLVKAFCRESYNPPVAVYEKLKRLGMDLVTVTDHDSIDAAEALRPYSDFFLSEEVTCKLPSGSELHVGVYDIIERDHIEMARRRNDFESFSAYLVQRGLFFSANHVFSSLTGRRAAADFLLFESEFPALETRNGHMLERANRNAATLADYAACVEVGGSDAHTMASVGCAYTVVPRARTKEEFLLGLRHGFGRVRGECGGVWKLTRDVLAIGRNMVREDPRTVAAAPLALAVPLITLGNYIVEQVFARWWMSRYQQLRAARRRNAAATPVLEAAV